ncbi:putative Integrase [Burkholderiales bacterium]|jgi:integrase|nr:putative Integrase [Burkholderiales bacterium]
MKDGEPVPRIRGTDRLSAKLVEREMTPGLYTDGRGLAMVVERLKDRSIRRRWIFRYASPTHRPINPKTGTLQGWRREMGLGLVDDVPLAKVREIARGYREQVAAKVDPIDKKRADEAAERAESLAELERKKAKKAREQNTLLRVAREYHERKIEPERTDKHAGEWIASIENHIPVDMLDRFIGDITAKELLAVMLDLRTTVRETSRRVAQRLRIIFADAVLHELIPANPMLAIAHELRESRRDKAKHRTNHASLPYKDVPAFIRALRAEKGMAAKALEFLILTAGRTAEVIGATWSEIDLDAKTWTVLKERMKALEAHVVYLSPRAVEILKAVRAIGASYVFTNPLDPKKPLSNMSMLVLLKRMAYNGRTTAHGFRSSFSTWANETGAAKPDVIEAALAHREQDRIRAAYNRSEFIAERSKLLDAWAAFIDVKPTKVTDIVAARTKTRRKAA